VRVGYGVRAPSTREVFVRLIWSALLAICVSATVARAADSTAVAPPRDPNLPAGEENAKDALNASPRHGEMVNVPMAGGPVIQTWIVYPERKDKAGVVLVIHEVYGLSDWVRGVADQLAREGFIAVVPDLISGMGPGGGGTDSVAGRDDVVKLVRALTPEETRRRLDTVRTWALAQPAAKNKYATIGFCWGGGKSFEYAATDPEPKASVVYYGVSPDSLTLTRVKAPVIGFYGGDDERVDATIDPAQKMLKKLGKSYEPHVYAGAGHGFLRAQSQRDGANLKAAQQAWPLTIAFLKKHLE
jgi:carboxymethylenebutenolidase